MAIFWRRFLTTTALAIVFAVGCGDPDDGEELDENLDQYECVDDGHCTDDDAPFCAGAGDLGGFFDEPVCTGCADHDHCQEPQAPNYEPDADFCLEGECVECLQDDQCEDSDHPYCAGGQCHAENVCAGDEDCEDPNPYCDETTFFCTDVPPSACQDHDDCTGGRPWCHDGNCVSEDIICQAQDCAGERGVCNPAAGVHGDCVNADDVGEDCEALADCTEDYMCIEGDCIPEEDACADCTEDESCEHNNVDLKAECVLDLVCEPGSRECDEDFLVLCVEDGEAEQTTFCTEGCIEDGDDAWCAEPQGETCDAPFMLDDDSEETLQTWDLHWSEFTNNYAPDPASGCIDEEHDLRVLGADVVFGAELEPGEVAVVELITVLDYATLYMLDGCTDSADSCLEPQGELFDTHDDGYIRALWYENDGDDTEEVYIVADTGTGAVNHSAEANLVVSEQVCNPGDDVCSEGELGECSTYGTHYVTDPSRECTYGCETDDPADPYCEPEDHSTCADPVIYDGEGTESFTGDIIDFHADETLDTSMCVNQTIGTGAESQFEGPTAYYEVDLSEGERLNADLAAQFDAGLWVTDSCDASDCQAAVNADEPVEHLSYVADEAETVNVVVQAVEEGIPDGEFTLSLSIDPPDCQGKDAGHVLECDGDDIRFCDGTDYPDRFQCDGGCEDGACTDPTGDTCLDPVELTPGTSVDGAFNEVSDELTPLGCADADDFNDPVGPDTVYELELDDDQLVEIDIETISEDAGFYLLDDCPVAMTNVEDQCIGGSIPGSDGEFFIQDAGTYYVVVDSGNRFDPADFTLTVDTQDAVCLPGAERCSGTDVQLCDDDGDDFETITTCAIDCDDDAVACTAPDDTNDRCGDDAFFIDDDGGQIVDDFQRFEQQENLNEGEGDCFDDGTSGPDAFYEFDLDAEQGVSIDANVDIDDSGSHDVGMYIAEGCVRDSGDIDCETSVVFSGDDQLEETLDFYTGSGGTFTLGLAGVSDFDSGEFALDFQFFDGECDPDDADDNYCDDGTAVQCNNVGQIVETSCEFGCENAECLDKKGDFCDRPWDLDEDGDDDGDDITLSVDGNIGQFSDGYNPYQDGESCTGYYGDGPDLVITFEGWADDELEVELDSNYDGAIWVTTDCDNAASQCVAGANDVFGPGEEVLEHTLDAQDTYYIIADSTQTGATGDFDLDVTLEKGPRDDDNGDE